MVTVNLNYRKTLITIGLSSLFSVLGYSFSSLAKAQALTSTKPQPQVSNQQQNFLKCGYRHKEITLNLYLEPPKNSGFTGERVDQALSRCRDYSPPIPLTALIPESNLGITVAEYPTLFFYIPDADLQGVEGEFVLSNDKNEEIYKKTLPLKSSDSIVTINLSDLPSLPPLEVGKFYFWNFGIIFDRVDRSDSAYVGGWLKRIEPNTDLKLKLKTALPNEKPAIYAANGIWHEAVGTLAKLRCTAPNDSTLASDWESLLQQVGLPEISTKPLAQCN